MVRVGEEKEDLEEAKDSESDESRGREVRYHTSTCMRKDDSGLEDELEYFWEAPIPSDSDEREEDRWWSPGTPRAKLRRGRGRGPIPHQAAWTQGQGR